MCGRNTGDEEKRRRREGEMDVEIWCGSDGEVRGLAMASAIARATKFFWGATLRGPCRPPRGDPVALASHVDARSTAITTSGQ